MKQFLIIFAFFFSLISCEGVNIVDTSYSITCYDVPATDSVKSFPSEIVSHVFLADTADYSPANYDDALEGILSHKYNGTTVTSYMNGTYDSTIGEVCINNITTEGYHVFVLCDTKNRMYAYRRFEILANLPQIITSLEFQPYQFASDSTKTVTVSGWLQQIDHN
ncbi:MAG: hypothetical protein R3Y50_05135 [Rikenellaceae bacterium]